jgi:hypothetical protein
MGEFTVRRGQTWIGVDRGTLGAMLVSDDAIRAFAGSHGLYDLGVRERPYATDPLAVRDAWAKTPTDTVVVGRWDGEPLHLEVPDLALERIRWTVLIEATTEPEKPRPAPGAAKGPGVARTTPGWVWGLLAAGVLVPTAVGVAYVATRPKRVVNPSRPPRRWFARMRARVAERGNVADPDAVAASIWWQLPPATQAQILREERA